MKEVTEKERKHFVSFWKKQRAMITGRMFERTILWFDLYARADNIGYGRGQLRPGKLGQWDLYRSLTHRDIGCDRDQARFASGLTVQEVLEYKRRREYRRYGLNPDNANHKALYERLSRMSLEDLDLEVRQLERKAA